jgi:hypothetical protein
MLRLHEQYHSEETEMFISDFRFLRYFNFGFDYVLWSLRHVDVGNVADNSEIRASSIFRVEMPFHFHRR